MPKQNKGPINQPTVSVVLLNYNGGALLAHCTEHVLAQTYPKIEFIVVDNDSTDGSLEQLEERWGRRVEVIRNGANLGFSRAINVGFQAAGGDYLMPLNFDVMLEPDYISILVQEMEADAAVGSLTGKLMRFNEAGPTGVIDSAGHVIYGNRYVRNIGEDQPDTGQYDQPAEVFGVTGAAPLYRRTMLDDIAFQGEVFDESFFIMTEDVDLDWRARLRGWHSRRISAAVALHYRGAAAGGKSHLLRRHYYKNRYLLMLKNDTIGSRLKHLPAIWLMDIYLFVKTLITAPIVIPLAWYDIIRLLPLTLKKRRHIQGTRQLPAAALERWFEPYRWRDDIKRKLGAGG